MVDVSSFYDAWRQRYLLIQSCRSSAESDPSHRAVCEQRSRPEKYFSGRGVVLAISHMGSWELYAQAAFQRPETRFGTVYQALRNPYLDELINRDRRKGVETFDRKRGSRLPLPCCDRPGCTAVLVDQSAGNGGIWMPFFNRMCSTSPLAAALAIRTNSAVVPAAIYTSGFARWRVVYEEEILV